MPKRSKKTNENQLNLFSQPILDQQFNSEDEEWSPDDDYGEGREEKSRPIETQPPELIPLKLLKEAIKAQNPDDVVMQDLSEYVLPNLLRVAIGVTAKGGKFFDQIDEKKEEKGEPPVRRDNAGDQSFNTHLLNGLFPANLIEQRLEQLDTTVQRFVKEQERRLAIAGFILHDFEKFDYQRFPNMPDQYKAVPKDQIRKLSLEEHREIIDILIKELNLDRFLYPNQPEEYQKHIDDLLYIAYNAQKRNDTNLNTSEFGLNKLTLKGKQLKSLTDLAYLADSLASVIKHPQDIDVPKLQDLIQSLSDRQLKFTYHRIAENRGVLTNVINNALMDEHTGLNRKDCQYFPPFCHYYEPLLYLPTGIIYLQHKNAPPISTENLPEKVIDKIKNLCIEELKQQQKGFVREGKGMKYAEYYELFFDDIALIKVALDATRNTVKSSKAQDRSQSLQEFQKKGGLSAQYNFEFSSDVRIDQLAEFGDLVTRKIWSDRVAKIIDENKKNKSNKAGGTVQLPDDLNSSEQLVYKIIEFWNLGEYLPAVQEIQNINAKLKELKLKGNTGGLPLEWYYLAAKYIEHHPSLEDIQTTGDDLITYLAELLNPILQQNKSANDGWEDLRLWLKQVVMLPTGNKTQADQFLKELKYYQSAKQPGRGKQLICSISHSAYTVKEQMESAVLFTPQVYTNKQMLGGSNAKRNISSIDRIELMLRQILMSKTQSVGKSFEDGKYRYLYFYPTYYFTPETNCFLAKVYDQIVQTRFDTGIRNHFISQDLQADFSLERYQSVDLFKLSEGKKSTTDEKQESKKSLIFKLNYPEEQPLTFYFMALPPEKRGKTEPTDTESWVMPTWLAFAFPMILDVKTVVSESPIPPFTDGTEFEQTVFLDSAPQAFRVLTQEERFRLDYILEGWEKKQSKYPAPLKVLTAAYAINLDVNARKTKTGYNPNWGKLSELARDFETSPLYVFSYLKNWVRSQNLDTPSKAKIRLYAYQFYPCFDPHVEYNFELEDWTMTEQSKLHHPKKLTELYRKFYRAKSTKGKPTKANAILKPIDEAADVILKAELSWCQGEAMVDAVAARLFSLMNRVHSSTAEGRWVFKNSERDQEREAILDFARYFVVEVFEGTFKGDRARLAGRQLNLIRDTCEFIYRLEDDKEYRARKLSNDDSKGGDSQEEE